MDPAQWREVRIVVPHGHEDFGVLLTDLIHLH